MVETAYAIGRSGDWFSNLQTRWNALTRGASVPVRFDLDRNAITASLQEHFGRYEQPAKNAGLSVNAKNEFVVTPSQMGRAFDWGKILAETQTRIEHLQRVEISITLADDYPEMTEENVNSALQLAEEIVANAPYTIALQDRSWKISAPQIRSWLKFVAEPSDLATEQNRDLQAQPTSSIQTTIGFNEKLVLAF